MSRISNRRDKDRKRRRALRARLEDAGVDPDTIERIIRQRRDADHAKRQELAELLGLTKPEPEWDQLDDTGYRPDAGDPLLRGAGRADGMAGRVARRKNTITHHQYKHEVDE